MGTVTGDAHGVRDLGCSFHSSAQTASSSAASAGNALLTLSPLAFSGPRADAVRSYVGELKGAAESIAEAYRAVADFIPTVATAIEDAKRAETARDHARTDLDAANRALGAAEMRLIEAQAAIPAPALSISAPVAAVTAPTPAQLAAVTAAQRDVDTAQRQVDKDQGRYQRAEQAFQEADDHRKRVMAVFAVICEAEAEIAGRAVPEPPAPGVPAWPGGPFTAYSPVTLQLEAQALANLPFLNAWGFSVQHLKILQVDLSRVDWNSIDTLAATARHDWQVAHEPKPGPGFPMNVVDWVEKHFISDAAAAGGALVDSVKGIAEVAAHPDLLLKAGEYMVEHPGRFLSQALNLKEFSQDPEKAIAALIPTIALSLVSDGAAAATDKLGEASAKAAAAAGRVLAHAPDFASDPAGLIHAVSESGRLVDKMHHYDQASAALEGLSSRLDVYDKVGTVAAVGMSAPGPCGEPGQGGLFSDKAAGDLSEHLGEKLLK